MPDEVYVRKTCIIGLDTQASGSITNDPRLVDTSHDYGKVTVTGWDGQSGSTIYSRGKNSLLGPLVLSEDSAGTLLSYKDLLNHFDVVWSEDGQSCKATSKVSPRLTLSFKLGRAGSERTLTCDLSRGVYEQLVVNAVAPREWVTDEDWLMAMDKPMLARAKEVLRFHNFVHPSKDATKRFIKHSGVMGIPFTAKDVDRSERMRRGGCVACTLAKPVPKQPMKTRQNREEVEPPVEPEADEHLLGEDTQREEELGIDCFFIDGKRYLIAVGKYGKLISVVALKDGRKPTVGAAMTKIIDAYSRNRRHIMGASAQRKAEQNPDTPIEVITEEVEASAHSALLRVGRVVSDGEQAIVSSAMECLQTKGITVRVMATGEHVAFVERPIRTIKERHSAIKTSLPYKLTEELDQWLVIHIINWLNLFPHAGDELTPDNLHTRRSRSYKALTRAEFGEPVVATAVGRKRDEAGCPAESGICVGFCPHTDQSIYFYSLRTKEVKLRARFKSAPMNLVEVFGANPARAPEATYAQLVGNYNPALFEPPVFERYYGGDSEWSPLDVDRQPSPAPPRPPPERFLVEDDNVYHPNELSPRGEAAWVTDEGPADRMQMPPSASRREPSTPAAGYGRALSLLSPQRRTRLGFDLPAPTAADSPAAVARPPARPPSPMMSPAAPSRVTEEVVKAKQPERVDRRHLSRHSGGGVDYKALHTRGVKQEPGVVSVARLCDDLLVRAVKYAGLVQEIDLKATGFKRAVVEHGEEASKAIRKEIKQLAVDFNVMRPSRKSYSEVAYHRSHDLFNVKLDGTLKARCVVGRLAKGEASDMDWGIDLHAPTLDMKLLSLMLSICLEEDLTLEVWDVRAAFLKAEVLREGIYVRLEPHVAAIVLEFKPEWSEFLQQDKSMLVELQKAWYGIAPAPALWNKEVSGTLTKDLGYSPHRLCPCLFYKVLADGRRSYILLHVDDFGIMMPRDGKERNRVYHVLVNKYEEMKVQQGDDLVYIGVEVARRGQTFELSMRNRILKLCKKFGVSKGRKYPLPAKLRARSDADEAYNNTQRYRSVVMAARYIAMTVMPEVLFATTYLASHQVRPSVLDYQDAIGVLEYVYGARDNPVTITALGRSPKVRVYADASDLIHLTDSKGHGGTTVWAGACRGAIFSQSGKLHQGVRHSTDAECLQLEQATLIGDYYHRVLEELGYDNEVIYMQDNDAAITLCAEGTHAHDRKRKHMIACINSVYDYLSDPSSNASLEAVITGQMHADIMTKSLVGELWERHASVLHGRRNMSELPVVRERSKPSATSGGTGKVPP